MTKNRNTGQVSPPSSPTTSQSLSPTSALPSSSSIMFDATSNNSLRSHNGADDDNGNVSSKSPPTRKGKVERHDRHGSDRKKRREKKKKLNQSSGVKDNEILTVSRSVPDESPVGDASVNSSNASSHDADDRYDDPSEFPGAVRVHGPDSSRSGTFNSTARSNGLPHARQLETDDDGVVMVDGFQSPGNDGGVDYEERMVQRIADKFREQTVQAEQVTIQPDNGHDQNGVKIFSSHNNVASAEQERNNVNRCFYAMIAVMLCISLVAIVVIIMLLTKGDKKSPELLAPTSAPTLDRISPLVSILESHGVIGLTNSDQLDLESPQYQALYWLAYKDGNALDTYINNDEVDILIERYALAVLFYSTSGSDNKEWRIDFGWVEDRSSGTKDESTITDVCDWYGVKCHSNETTADTTLYSHVRALDLGKENLTG